MKENETVINGRAKLMEFLSAIEDENELRDVYHFAQAICTRDAKNITTRTVESIGEILSSGITKRMKAYQVAFDAILEQMHRDLEADPDMDAAVPIAMLRMLYLEYADIIDNYKQVVNNLKYCRSVCHLPSEDLVDYEESSRKKL